MLLRELLREIRILGLLALGIDTFGDSRNFLYESIGVYESGPGDFILLVKNRLEVPNEL